MKRKILIVFLGLIVAYLAVYCGMLTKARWPLFSHKIASCSDQKEPESALEGGLVVHKSCEPKEQANITNVQALFKRLPGELQSGKASSIAGGDTKEGQEMLDAKTLKQILPYPAYLKIDTASWRRTGPVGSFYIKVITYGVLPKTENYIAIMAKEGDDWKLSSTMSYDDAKSIGLDQRYNTKKTAITTVFFVSQLF